MALAGELDALVTAPIEKGAFRAGGWHFPGHTEMLHELTGVPAVGMMMSAERTLAADRCAWCSPPPTWRFATCLRR
jgi:4-hydroxy-L-threonine phosphate dehydrogenase PdxA